MPTRDPVLQRVNNPKNGLERLLTGFVITGPPIGIVGLAVALANDLDPILLMLPGALMCVVASFYYAPREKP